ncbi:DUF2920 family protein [Campylobacter volucris]|uniref:DUF2920 family protein n=1 Tax=Campylobacter volucris TaxID=1031542 RepID=A0AAE5YG34_9BACT|nr:DUF2920 family protein [Campylobacter volucris]AJC94585.1 hypothetical protein (DUF2920 domain) [Campylobacter volucris LMG 24379]KAB0577684.1 DUF2920 family protein [Campylobacter volucris]QBL13066.1 DUF2920 family protein [Campylobacter volucris]QEL08802.1 DUF2920 domain-containing protein [Campylobacter volucris]TXK71453.1 DUF2920 family protein [Campylobacter volucris]
MIINKTYEINSCDDVELNIKRESKVEFKLIYDDSKEIEALVCIIPGLGGDINDNLYIDEYCARNYNVAVLSVNYHCIGNRPQTGALFYINELDKFILKTSLEAIGIQLPIDVQNLKSYDEFYCVADVVNKFIERLKREKELNEDYHLYLSVGFEPTKNEYQNFGIMQATDIINAILYVKSNLPFKITGWGIKTILVGSSHGGYLANLCVKIAPWSIDTVVDNSSHITLDNDLWRFVGFGREIDYIKYCSAGLTHIFKNIKLAAFDKTHWTSNSSSPNYFSNARKIIREPLNKEHLKVQSLYPKPKYIAYHSKFDQYVPLEEREEYFNILKDLGFEIDFTKITSENEIDGKFIKNLEHGCGIPMKLLIKKHLDEILKEPLQDKSCKKEISYKCDDLIYTFKEEDDQIRLEIKQ